MKINELFATKINRDMNPVITVGDNADLDIKTEIEEYVVTKELRPHFDKFFTNFADALDRPSKKIGVWISGFYGSGKSHFLKMLAYLLENKVVAGKPTIEYFHNKFNDEMLSQNIERCCVTGRNKTILFNIDSFGGKEKSIVGVFAQKFYESIGFYGKDPKIVSFERWVASTGKMGEFKAAYKALMGHNWEEKRALFNFNRRKIAQAVADAGICSLDEANDAVNAPYTAIDNIDSLVDDIADFVKKQDPNFRLIFMVDEVGQYIGEDTSLMLNLETIVENLWDKCHGKVWVVVTAQEAIDHVIKVKGDQFMKIMDRFATKLHLSASSVEEVIRKRLLSKNKTGEETLKVIYEQKAQSLKNTFTFEQANSDLKGYRSDEEFVGDYPFVSYQYKLLQDSLEGIRVHKQSVFTLGGGSRNMLGSFHFGLTKAVEGGIRIQDGEIGNGGNGPLFPFHLFYDAIEQDLVSTIREILNKATKAAERNEGLKLEDVQVLKCLYLIRYVDNDLKATLNNIAILMTSSIDEDQIALRNRIGQSLDRLRSQNYATKNGEVWMFLTDEERDVDVEISSQIIDSDEVAKEIGTTIFSDIYPLKKAQYGIYNFDFDRYVDDLAIGTQTRGMKFSIISPNNAVGKDNDTGLIMESAREQSSIAVLSSDHPFYDKLLNVLKVEKYQKVKGQASLPAGVKTAISARVAQARLDRIDVKANIEKALKDAIFYVDGRKEDIKGATAKDKVAEALKTLVEAKYTSLNLITYNLKDESEIRSILNRGEGLFENVINQDAVDNLNTWLITKYQSNLPVTVADIYRYYRNEPFGFREYDIAGMVAELLFAQKIVLSYHGKEYKKTDAAVLDLLLKKSYIDGVVVNQRMVVDPALLAKCINILKDFTECMDVPNKEDDFLDYAIATFTKKSQECQDFLDNYYSHESYSYPQKETVLKAKELYNDILLNKTNDTKFLQEIQAQEDNLLDMKDDIQDIVSFFAGRQKSIYDDAVIKLKFYSDDQRYIHDDANAQASYNAIQGILSMGRPFSRIAELPSLVATLKSRHDFILSEKKNEAGEQINQCREEWGRYVQDFSKDIYEKYSARLSAQKSYINNADKIIGVADIEQEIQKIREEGTEQLLNAKKPEPSNVDLTATERDVAAEPKQTPTPVTKESILESATLKTKSDIDQYVDNLKKKLYAYIIDGGVEIN